VTIRRRLALAAASAVAVAIALASLGAYLAVQARMRDEIDSSLRQRAAQAQAIAPLIDIDQKRLPRPPRIVEARSPEARFGGAAGLVQFITRSGRVRQPAGSKVPTLPVDKLAKAIAAGHSGPRLADATVRGQHLRVLTTHLRGGGALQVARPLNEVDGVLHDLVLILIAITIGGIGVAALLGGAISRTSLRPIRRFTEETESVAEGHDLSQRLRVDSSDEIGRLAQSYNTLLAALQRSADAQRQLVSDASHELRTPLTTLKTNLETLLRQNGRLSERDRAELEGDLVEQIDELTLLVDDVVELARRGEAEPHPDEVQLEEVVRIGAQRVKRHAPGLDLRLDLDPWTVQGAPERLGRAVYNLLDNAAKWSPEGGSVEIGLQHGELTVRDHGPGIEPSDLPFIFDRFYRARDARGRPGSGLGLAIVRQIAEAHGAELEAENAPGGGAVLKMRFPPSPP
jgi:two-component system sensor histidine kinase MprB